MKTTVRLTESAVMLALATVLSMLPLVEMPYGGSITACSGLPLLVIAYRHGTKWGLFAGLVYGLLQMFLGMKNVMYFTTPLSIAAVILLDYLLAFAVLGLGGLFRNRVKNQTAGLLCGALIAYVLRYLLHVIAGATVWAGLSIPTEAALLYSFAYNLTYMLPETVVCLLGAALVSGVLNLRSETPARTAKEGGFDLLACGAGLVAVATLITDVCLVFMHLQDGETGDFAVTGLAQVDWGLCGLITVIGLAVAAVLLAVRRMRRHA